jgi:OPA family sugar phosphate sensor protein UhpC-like MFS transporter
MLSSRVPIGQSLSRSAGDGFASRGSLHQSRRKDHRRSRVWVAATEGSFGERASPEDPATSSGALSGNTGNRLGAATSATDGLVKQHQDERTGAILEGADPVTDAKYGQWRIRIFYSIFLGYAFFYFTRNSFTYTAPALRAALGLSLEQLGIIVSVFPLAYGFSKLFLGIAADRFSSRGFMAVGIMLTGLVNILFGLQSNVHAMTALWFLNGIFQGSGAAPCAKLLTRWYSKNERGTWWGLWNTSHNTGGFFIPLIVGYCMKRFGWRYGMIVPGVLGILMGLFLLNRLRDRPEDVGLPPVEVYRDDGAEKTKSVSTFSEKPADRNGAAADVSTDGSGNGRNATPAAGAQASTNKFLEVVGNPYVLLLAISYFFIYFCRQGISSWTVIYLTSMGVPPREAAFRVGSMEIGGLCGSLVSGAVSDRLARGRRIPVILVWMLGVVAALVGMWLSPASWRYLSLLSIFMFGFFIYGPQMLVGLAASEMVSPDSVSSTIGFLGWIAYIGAATSGYPLTRIVSAAGWDAYFAALIGCAGIAILLLLPMWRIGARQAKAIALKWRALVAGAAANFQSLAVQGDGQYIDCEACAGAGTRLRLECGPATPAQSVSCKLVEVPCEDCHGTGRVPLTLDDAVS